MSDTKCGVCGQPASQKCGGCHRIYYCSKDHQKRAWKTHKLSCRPFQTHEDELLGRHLTAVRAIKPGEVVLRERPLVFGPSQTTVPVCLGCGKVVTGGNSTPCSKCGWPVCGSGCENAVPHKPECFYTAQAGKKMAIHNFEVIHPSYQCITVLRCLYQKQFAPHVWDKLNLLESHCKERQGTEKYESDRKCVASFIQNYFKLEDVFTTEEILRVCGVVMVNGHEVPTTVPSHVAVYETASMLEHNCRANCCKSFAADGSVLVSSCEGIQVGEHLSICYTDPMWGTANRRNHLQETKFFWCRCGRCADPTEFGTCFSAVRCRQSGCTGTSLPSTFFDATQDWSCSTCKTPQPSFEVQEMLQTIGGELQGMPKGSSEACTQFLARNEKHLHRNHFYLTDVRIALAQIMGQETAQGLPGLSDVDLRFKIQLCKQLGDLMQVIAPGEKRLRGVLLFELHAGVAELGRRLGVAGEGPAALHASLVESREILVQAVDLLKHEPDVLPEGKIYKQAVENLRNMDVLLRTVYQAVGDSPS